MTQPVSTIQVQVNSPLDATGGGAVHARGLARALRERGVCVSVLCTGWSGYSGDGEFGNVITVRPKNLPLLWRRPPLGTLPGWVRAVRKHAMGVDAIVALSAEMAVASHVARPRTPVVYCPAALNGFEHPSEHLTPFQRCERRAFRASAGVVFPAEAVRDEVERLYGPLGVPTAVCPLGVDFNHISGGRDVWGAYGIPRDAFFLLTVGVVNENKSQALIARALADSAPPDWWWVIVGDGPGLPEVKAALRGTTFGDRAMFAAQATPVADWYATADVLVSASRCETFGLTVAEAMTAGVPVVVPENRPGVTLSPLAEAVAREGLGRTFDRERPETLAVALENLAMDDRIRAHMGDRAREFARAHFSWGRYADCVLGLITSARCGSEACTVGVGFADPTY